MAHQHEGAGELEQGLLENIERRDVEVVGGLIEDEQVGRLEHHPGEDDPGALAS